MANLTAVLFGDRLFGDVTYEENYDPETFDVALTDDQSTIDTDAASVETLFAEIQVLSDVFGPIDTIKVLSETMDSVDAITGVSGKPLADILFGADSLRLNVGRALSDFILVKEWTKIKLHKSNVWTSHDTIAQPAPEPTLFEPPMYATDLFASGPSTLWEKPSEDDATWTDAATQNSRERLTVYAQPLFGQALFSDTPTVNWTKPEPREEEWVNFNGESHN